MLLEFVASLVTHVFSAAAQGAVRSVQREARRDRHEAQKPSEARVRFIEAQYRSWARSRGMTWDEANREWRGRVSSCAVRVKPGLAGSSPGFAFADVEVAHDRVPPVLVTPSSPREEPLIRAMAEVFEDADLEGKLRAISIVPSGLSLRFASLTLPEIVESAIDAAVRRIPRDERPYR